MNAILRAHRPISMEMIDFQTDNFGEKLEVVFADIKSKIKSGEIKTAKAFKESEECKKLISLTLDRIGMTIQIVVSSWVSAAVLPFYSNKNHIFLHQVLRGDVLKIKEQDAFLKKNENGKGTVNTETVRLSGIFTEHPIKIYLNPFFFFKDHDFSPSEVTAIYLHEVGHGFYACEYSDRLSTTNQILSDLTKSIFDKKSKGDVVYIYKELKGINPRVTDTDIDQMLNGNKVIAGMKWFEYIIGTVQHQLSNSKYDETSFEMLADNFTARFGYGRDLVTALEKISEGGYEKSRSLLLMIYTYQTVFFAAMLFLAISPFVAGFIIDSILMAMIGGLYLYVMAALSSENNIDYTYDKLIVRYKRIRSQIVEYLKNSELGKQEIEESVRNLYEIDEAIKSTYSHNHFLRIIMNYISPNARAAKKSIDEQQLLEDMANSDLFVKAAILKASVG